MTFLKQPRDQVGVVLRGSAGLHREAKTMIVELF